MNFLRQPRKLLLRILLAPVVGCAFALTAPPAVGQSNTKAAGYYEDALVRYDKKDIAGAIIQLKNALQIDPNMLPVQLLLGKALMRNGEMAAAEVAFTEALRLGVNRAEVAVQLGQALVAQGKHRDVLARSTFAPAGLPHAIQLQILLLRASVHADVGDPTAALRSIAEARALDERHAETWLAEVPIRIRSRQFNEATTAANTALTLAPESAEAMYQKGSIAHVQGALREALSAYDRALQTDKTHTEARVARIGIALDQGRFDDAKKDVAELQKSAPRDPRGAYMKALLSERDGDMNSSRASLKEVTELLDPVPIDFIRYRPQLLMLNGLAHFGLSQGEKSKQYLEAFQRSQPVSPVSKLLARIYMADGNTAQAINLLEPYLRAQPGDGQAILLLARAHMASGRNAKATALMREALKARNDPSFRTTLGLSLISDGQTTSGMAELESVYKKDPQQIQAATALAQLYLRNGQAKKAIPIAEQLVKAQGNNANYHNLLGMAFGQSGNVAAARSAFTKAIALDAGLRQGHMNLAKLDIATHSYDAAVARLTDLLKADPKYSEAMHEMAIIANRRGQQPDAQRWLEKARDAAPSNDNLWDLALVDFHLANGRTGQAFDAAKSATSKRPDDLNTLMAYSRAAIASGDLVAAKSALTSATRFAEYDPPRQVEIARLQIAANNLAGAAYSIEKALSSAPDYLPGQAFMAEVELRQGETAKAETRAREVAAQNPRLAIGHSLLGDVAMAKNQLSAAIDAYRRAFEAEPGTTSALRLFHALSHQDGGKPALQFAEQWLKKNGRDLAVQKAMADVYARAGDYSAAKTAYRAALSLQPGDAEVLNNLANVQIRLKDPGSVKTAETALANAPGNALVIDTLGWALFNNGQIDKALQSLRDARLRQPANPEIRYHLAAVLAQSGRNNEAIEEVSAALATGVGKFDSMPAAEALLQKLRKSN